MKQLFYLMLCVALLVGCGKDKSIEGPDEPDEPEMPAGVTLELSDADMVFEAEGGEKTFTITCSTDWTIANESDWCTTDVTSGSGNRTVTVTALTYGELADRNTNVTVRAGDKTKVLTVTQKYGEAIIPDKAKFEVPQEGGDLSIKVRSSVTYEVSIPDFCNSWIRSAPETRSEISDTTYRFIIDANGSDDSRTGCIVFSSGSVQDTVRIYQAQKDCLVLTQKAYSLLANDTTISVELRTNVDYDVTILGEASSWISRVETRASRVDRLQFHIDENTGGVLRTAKIAVQDKNGVLTDTIYIRQSDTDDPFGQDITADFDPEFAKVLEERGYIPDATHITIADVKDIGTLDVSGTYENWGAGKGLTSLKGIEYFESLTDLRCSSNQLTSLDVSRNTALIGLNCSSNQLTSLDVSNNTALIGLICSSNQLTSLNVSQNTALKYLDCEYNHLTSLDVSNNTALIQLFCDNNQFTSLDVSGCTALTDLRCSSNQLTSLDVSNNTALSWLSCFSNHLTSLDVSNNTALTVLECRVNQLTSLDVSNNTALTDLRCSSNQLTSLDVSRCTALTRLNCYGNHLTSLDVSNNIVLTDLDCSFNQFTSLDVSKNAALEYLYCNENQLTSLDVSQNTALTNLSCYFNLLTSLDVSKNTALTDLNCYLNQLTSLDVSNNTALTDLDCSFNQFTSLDVSKNTALTNLSCHSNLLTSLDVSNNIVLEQLICSYNPGDGESLFPVTAWFDNDNIPENMNFRNSWEELDGKSWEYDGKTIRIDFRKAE